MSARLLNHKWVRDVRQDEADWCEEVQRVLNAKSTHTDTEAHVRLLRFDKSRQTWTFIACAFVVNGCKKILAPAAHYRLQVAFICIEKCQCSRFYANVFNERGRIPQQLPPALKEKNRFLSVSGFISPD